MMANDAPTVVLLPGAGDVPASWLPVQRMLTRPARVHVYDRAGTTPGFEGAPRTLDACIAELHAEVRQAGGRVVLVGHSFGGLLAQAYAERRPDRIAGLVLVDATPVAVAHNRGVAAGFAVSASVARMLRLGARAGLVRMLLGMRALPLYPEQRAFERVATSDELRTWKADVEHCVRGGAAAELAAVLPAAREATELTEPSRLRGVPIRVLASRAYGPQWEAMQEELAARFEGARVRKIGDRHHNIPMAHPDFVADAIDEVLAGVSPSEAPRPA